MATGSSFQDNSSSTGGDLSSVKKEHILVIRFSAMGDVAMLVPVLRAVVKKYPHLKITVLTRGFFAPIFKNIPNVDVYEADLKGLHNGTLGLCRLAKELRDMEINTVADVHNVLRSNMLNSVFYFYGIKVKQIDKGRGDKKALTAENNKVFKQLKTTAERYADVFAELGYPVKLDRPQFPGKQKLSPNTIALTGKILLKWVGIAPFAQHPGKVYPLDLMEEVIAKTSQSGKMQIFLFGGGKAEIEKLENLASKYENVTSVAGKLRFEEELALISNLDVMLSMDSGNAHLAAIYGIPVITLWGMTHPYAGFAAFNQPQENHLLPDLYRYPKIPTSIYGNKIPEGYEEAMRSISPDSVVRKLEAPRPPMGE